MTKSTPGKAGQRRSVVWQLAETYLRLLILVLSAGVLSFGYEVFSAGMAAALSRDFIAALSKNIGTFALIAVPLAFLVVAEEARSRKTHRS